MCLRGGITDAELDGFKKKPQVSRKYGGSPALHLHCVVGVDRL
jgi:hypothetical protein